MLDIMLDNPRLFDLQGKWLFTCRFCKFWVRSDEEVDRGSCACPKFKLGYNVKELQPDEVQVEDDEGWGFMTAPNFGCIHFEVKNANP